MRSMRANAIDAIETVDAVDARKAQAAASPARAMSSVATRPGQGGGAHRRFSMGGGDGWLDRASIRLYRRSAPLSLSRSVRREVFMRGNTLPGEGRAALGAQPLSSSMVFGQSP
jgi:hypothetical protein